MSLRVVIAAVLLAFLVGACDALEPTPTPRPPTKQERVQAIADKCFSPWDGSYEPLSDHVKVNVLTFPDTWKHQETGVRDIDGLYFVETKFRASSPLLGQQQFTAMAQIDAECNMLEYHGVTEGW